MQDSIPMEYDGTPAIPPGHIGIAPKQHERSFCIGCPHEFGSKNKCRMLPECRNRIATLNPNGIDRPDR